MTTFQAIIYSIVHGFTEFLPISAKTHHIFISHVLSWPLPQGPVLGALSLGTFLSLLIYFRHDWASQISGILQVIIYRKKPMTLDERLPLFIIISFLPLMLVKHYLIEELRYLNWSILWIAVSFTALSFPILSSDYFSKKNRGMFDLSILDAILIGVLQTLSLIPGVGNIGAALMGGFFLNYNRETCAKFALYISAPILATASFLDLHGVSFHEASPASDVSWMTFYTIIIVTCLAGLLSIGGLMKNIQRLGLHQYLIYRVLVGAGMIAYLLIKG